MPRLLQALVDLEPIANDNSIVAFKRMIQQHTEGLKENGGATYEPVLAGCQAYATNNGLTTLADDLPSEEEVTLQGKIPIGKASKVVS